MKDRCFQLKTKQPLMHPKATNCLGDDNTEAKTKYNILNAEQNPSRIPVEPNLVTGLTLQPALCLG